MPRTPEADASARERSFGAVEADDLLPPREGRAVDARGLFSEVIFGPLRVLRCACGALAGEANRGSTCATCAVLCSDPSLRDWRFGHLEILPAVHPLLYAEVGAALGLTRDELVHIASRRSVDGTRSPLWLVDALRASDADALLLEAALVTRVPVPPPGDRPLVTDLMPTMHVPWVGPVNELWQPLIQSARQLRNLAALNASSAVLASDAVKQQDALAAVIAATLRAPAIHERTSWRVLAPGASKVVADRSPLVLDTAPPTPAARTGPVVRLLFIDDERLLLQTAAMVHVLWLDSPQGGPGGVELHRFSSPARHARSCEPRGPAHGALVMFDGWSDVENEWEQGPGDATAPRAADEYLTPLLAYDLDARAWLASWPADVAPVVAQDDEPEVLDLVDEVTLLSLACPWQAHDRPRLLAWSRDARFAWLGAEDDGGVLHIDTGIVQIEPAPSLAHAQPDTDEDRGGPRALGLTNDLQWRFVHASGDLSDGRTRRGHLGAVDAVAFAPGCTKIAVVRDGGIEVLDANGSMLRRLPLP